LNRTDNHLITCTTTVAHTHTHTLIEVRGVRRHKERDGSLKGEWGNCKAMACHQLLVLVVVALTVVVAERLSK